MVNGLRRLVPLIAPIAVGVVGVHGRPAGAAARPRRTGTRPSTRPSVPLLGTAHPTGFPTWVILAWLASIVLQPFGDPAFRMNLFAAICLGVAAGTTVVLARMLTRSTALGVLAGLGLGWHRPPGRSARTPRRTACTSRSRPSCCASSSAGRTGARPAIRRDGTGRIDGSSRPRSSSPCRWATTRSPCSLRHRWRCSCSRWNPRILRRRGWSPGARGPRRHGRRAVPGAAVAGRAVPGAARLRTARDLDGFLYVVLAEQFRGSVVDPFGDLGGKC